MSLSLPAPLVVRPDGSLNGVGVQENFDRLSSQVNADIQAWTEVAAFTNSWVNYTSGRAARYYIDRRRVFLDGLVKDGTIGTAAFTLPAGYRPDRLLSFVVNSADAFGVVVVDTDGSVSPTVGSSTWVSLTQVSFRVA